MSELNVIESHDLTAKDYSTLCKLSYIDLNVLEEYRTDYYNKTLKEVAIDLKGKEIPANGGLSSADFQVLLDEIIADENGLGALILKDYENDNISVNPNGTGFVAYAFTDTKGNDYFAFTGSEGAAQRDAENEISDFLTADGTDNYRLLYGSNQFDQVEQFVRDNA